MILGGDLPADIIRLILIKRFSNSVLSLENWKSCLIALAVCRGWRNIGVPLLYRNVIAEYKYIRSTTISRSNIPLAMLNDFNKIPKALFLYTPMFVNNMQRNNMVVFHLSYHLGMWTFLPGLMRNFWDRYIYIPVNLIGVSIEPALLCMPKLSHFFFNSEEFVDSERNIATTFINYSVGRQLEPRPFSPHITPEIDILLESTRQTVEVSSQKLLMRRGQGNDYVEVLSAEYVNRLIASRLAENLLYNSVEDELPNLADDILPDPFPYDQPWDFVRNRSMLFFSNIKFDGHFMMPSAYSLFVIDRKKDIELIDIDSEGYHGSSSEDDNNDTSPARTV